MALCDLSRLDRFTGSDAEAFLCRLREIGVNRQTLQPFSRLCERLPDPLRSPIRRWHLRRVPPPLGPILRAFFFGDPVPEDELRQALGAPRLFDDLAAAGMLLNEAGGLVCPLRLNLINELFIFTDDLTSGQDAVMGAGHTTASLIQAAWPTQRVSSILDLGCGAGTAALLMASIADEVVGVDISERALWLCKLNARLASLDRVEFLESDLFTAVAHRQFDIIVSQPPFVSCPTDTPSVTFLHGGARGDELALRLLERVFPHLTPGGRAVLLVDWPKYDDVTPTDRIRATIGDVPLDMLVLLGPGKDLDEHVTYYGSMLAPSLGTPFEAYVLAQRDHLERMRISELRLALIVLRRTERKPWTRLIETRPMMQSEPTGAQIDRIIAVQDLLAAETAALLQASLAIPPESRFVELDPGHVRVELPDSRLVTPVVTSRAGADLLLEVDRATTVAQAVEAMLARTPQLRQGGPERVLAGVRAALESGLLELREQPRSS
jgi:methylase of polypeptide subunit release factors